MNRPSTAFLERAAAWLSRHGWWVALLAIALFGAVVQVWCWHDYVFEDAFITYRYAHNLASGQGFVFNPGEHVLGTTTPLYTLVLAFFGLFGLPIPVVSGVLFALGLAGTGVLGALILRRVGSPHLALLFAAYMAWAAFALQSFWGLEIGFYLCLLMAAFFAALRSAPTWTGALLGLAFLMRYDAFVFVVPLLLLLWWRQRRIPWRTGLVALAVVVPWLLFAQLYFGSVLPNTLSSKSGTESSLLYFYDAVAAQIRQQGFVLIRLGLEYPAARLALAAVVLTLLGGLFAGCRRLLRREPYLTQALVYPILLLTGYAAIAPPVDHLWYLPPGAIFLVLLALGCWGVVSEEWTRRVRPRALHAIAGVVLAIALLAMPAITRADAQLRIASSNGHRIGAYRAMAAWLRDNGLEDLSVLTREPGYIGFHTRNRMIDGAGLITRGVKFHGPTAGRTPTDEILARFQPDTIVAQILGWDGRLIQGYVPFFETPTGRVLLVAPSALRASYGKLRQRWLEETPSAQRDPSLARHPLATDFEEDDLDAPWGGLAWSQRSSIPEPIEHLEGVTYAGIPVAGDYLTTRNTPDFWGAVSSPPFLIDFDRLTLRFAGTRRLQTAVRLVVDGQIVLEEQGQDSTALRDVSWPVGAWRGKVGFIQLSDSSRPGFAVLDHVRSVRDRNVRVLDDFESGAYGKLWNQTFGERPSTLEEVVVEHGLGFQVGGYGATSQGLEGRQVLLSNLFRIDHSRLSLLVFDFGYNISVGLRIRGELQRVFRGQNSGQLRAVTWELDDLIGQAGVLVAIDDEPDPARWVGVDEVRMYDPGDD